VVIVLATGPKDRSFKPGRHDGFSRTIKNPQHTFLRMGSKEEAPYRKILRHVIDILAYLGY
jgi:hypothetical protein